MLGYFFLNFIIIFVFPKRISNSNKENCLIKNLLENKSLKYFSNSLFSKNCFLFNLKLKEVLFLLTIK